MALDFFLGGLDAPLHQETWVALGLGSYGALMDAVVQFERHPMIDRIRDYYEDASWSPSEVPALKHELVRAMPRPAPQDLRDLLELCDAALDRGLGLCAVAD